MACAIAAAFLWALFLFTFLTIMLTLDLRCQFPGRGDLPCLPSTVYDVRRKLNDLVVE